MRYRKHSEYLQAIRSERERRAREIGDTVRESLGEYITRREAEEVHFEQVTADKLARLIGKNPSLLKPLIASCNMGKRAIRKDLGLELDTFRPRLTEGKARQIAEYLLPSLPESLLIEELIALDAYQWVDSAIRKMKGRWERQFADGLRARGVDCKKRKFRVGTQLFELDIAHPSEGDILFAVDVKMIGHPSDKHKRGDEIVNKAIKYNKTFPRGTFISLIYYPFDEDRKQLEDRLRSGAIEIADVIFAGDDDYSVRVAVNRLYEHFTEMTEAHRYDKREDDSRQL